MRFRLRFRFGMRTLLLAVLLAGVASYVFIVRARRFREVAESHRNDPYRLYYCWWGPSWASRRAEWSGEMQQKYEYAAAHPWLPVLPDPPMPGPDGRIQDAISPNAGVLGEHDPFPEAPPFVEGDDDPFRPLPPLPGAELKDRGDREPLPESRGL